MNAPKVFISYSHDSDEHKQWVQDLAEKMVNHGIEITLDQWDLKPGDNLPGFMEKSSPDHSDYIIIICTERYVEKVNSGKGGAAYEKMIMTNSLIQDSNTNKFIPIIRQSGKT